MVHVKCNYILTRFFPEIDNELVKVVHKILVRAMQNNPHLYCKHEKSMEKLGFILVIDPNW